MGSFNLVPFLEHDGRAVYQNEGTGGTQRYLYYVASLSRWQIGPDYKNADAGVKALDSADMVCPTSATKWQHWSNGRWSDSSPSITVDCDICKSFVVSGSTAQTSSMGTFDVVPSLTQNDRPVYKNRLDGDQQRYLYYTTHWQIGPDYLDTPGGLYAPGSDGMLWPPTSGVWLQWNGAEWENPNPSIAVQCERDLEGMLPPFERRKIYIILINPAYRTPAYILMKYNISPTYPHPTSCIRVLPDAFSGLEKASLHILYIIGVVCL